MATNHEMLLHRFGKALEQEGRAPSTRRKYERHVSHFLEWLGSRHPRELRRGEAREYLDEVGADRVRLAALKRFYGFLRNRDLLMDADGRDLPSPFEAHHPDRREQREPDPLTAEEDRLMLSAPMNAQERILVYLLRYTGLRIAEACALKVKDLDLDAPRPELRVRESKTRAGRRSVPIAPELEPELRMWLARQAKRLERYGSDSYVLATKHGTPMKPQFAWRLVKRVAKEVGVRDGGISPHTFRRTYGSDLLNRGKRIEIVSALLGHADVRVTQQSYARLRADAIRAEYWAVGA
jgi:integrase